MRQTQITGAVFLAFLSTVALAPAAPPATAAAMQAGVTTCWYNDNQELTGSETAPPGAKPGTSAQVGSGNHAWSYIISGHDGKLCPAKLPVSTNQE
jgi:hypothetical protein